MSFVSTTPAHVGFDGYYSTMPQAEISTTFNCGCQDGDPEGEQCIWGHWREGKDHALSKPHCDQMYLKNGTTKPAPLRISCSEMVWIRLSHALPLLTK